MKRYPQINKSPGQREVVDLNFLILLRLKLRASITYNFQAEKKMKESHFISIFKTIIIKMFCFRFETSLAIN